MPKDFQDFPPTDYTLPFSLIELCYNCFIIHSQMHQKNTFPNTNYKVTANQLRPGINVPLFCTTDFFTPNFKVCSEATVAIQFVMKIASEVQMQPAGLRDTG